MSAERTNVSIAAATLVLFLFCLPFHDLIPAGNGQGYDGSRYANWVRDLSIGSLSDSAADHWRQAPSSPLELDSYYAHRILPSLTLHYVMGGLGIDTSELNLLRTFTALNIVMLLLGMICWLVSADEFKVDSNGKWLGFLALVVSYANLKMPLYYPTLTDSAAFATGSACLLCYLKRWRLALWLCCFAGAFIWPTITYFGFFLVAFPRSEQRETDRGPRGLNTMLALAAALAVAAIIEEVISSGWVKEDTAVRPISTLIHLSVAVAAVYVFVGLRPLLDSRRLWQSLNPVNFLRTAPFFAGCLLLLTSELLIWLIGPQPPEVKSTEFLADTFWTAAPQPSIFFLAHVLYFGPILLFYLFLWPRVSGVVRAQGAGLVLCFAMAVVLSLGSESRRLINFLPFAIVFLVTAMSGVAATRLRWTVLAALTFLISKAWLPMDRTLAVPFAGELEWRTLYVSSRGPWIGHTAYTIQLLPVLLLLPLLYFWSKSARHAALFATPSESLGGEQPVGLGEMLETTGRVR